MPRPTLRPPFPQHRPFHHHTIFFTIVIYATITKTITTILILIFILIKLNIHHKHPNGFYGFKTLKSSNIPPPPSPKPGLSPTWCLATARHAWKDETNRDPVVPPAPRHNMT
ncbi:hypothetical protein RRG08_011772 [Elysia crispata]|uniref:Transmembrane protein n=1 Tax=Elysia crispata TaxID=231223 RepID=A0AAE0ZSF0_9GAST|nr:hypothetical protein RRG08_011772 [Elysia crispata]